MALQKKRERIKIRGGYFFVKDTSIITAMFRSVGFTEATNLSWNPAVEDVHDERGQYLGPVVGNDMAVAKPVGLQTTQDEIDIARGMKGKDLKILYLVPIKVLGVKKIQRYEFNLGWVVPNVELAFGTSKRTIPFEFRISPTSSDVWAAEDVASETILYESSDMAYKGISADTTLTNVIVGVRCIGIRCVAKSMEAGDKIRIGTGAGGQQVVADTDISAGGVFDFTIVGGETLGPTLYVSDDGSTTTPWAAGQDVDLYFVFSTDLIVQFRGLTGDRTLTNVIPAGYKATTIHCVAENMETGDDIRIGTTPGGQEVVADTDISAGGVFDLAIAGGETTGPTLYVADDGSTVTPWAASQKVDLYIFLEPV